MADAASGTDERQEVAKYARMLLKKAGVGSRLPTPVEDLVAVADLVVSQEVTLSAPHEGFFTRNHRVLASALRKLAGLIDLRQKVIYLDPSLPTLKRRFVQLHEIGHKILPWQADVLQYIDDEETIDPDVKEQFEQQASWFASDLLFQLDRFEGEAMDLPLSIKSPMALAKRYQASVHATTRRFVEFHRKPCVLLDFERLPDETTTAGHVVRLKTVVASPSFHKRFDARQFPQHPDISVPFVPHIIRRRKLVEDGEWTLVDRNGEVTACTFEFFDNNYRILVLVYPRGTHVRSRTKIVLVSRNGQQ